MTTPGMTTWDLVDSRAASQGDLTAFVDQDGRRVTFDEFRAAAERVAAGLHAHGVQRDVVVAWQLPTWIESFVLMAALSRLGALQVPLLPIYRSRELRHIVATTSPRLYIGPRSWAGVDYGDLIASSTGSADSIEVLLLDADRRLPDGDPAALPAAPSGAAQAERTRWIYHTSGTTAAPKGVKHNDRSVIASTQGWIDAARIDEHDVLSANFPLTHIGGLNLMLAGVMTGCHSIVVDKWGPESIDLLAREGCTLPGSGQVFFLAFLEAQRKLPAGARLFPKARAFPAGGAAKSSEMHYLLKNEMGAGLLPNFGMTECPMALTSPIGSPDIELAEAEGRASTGLSVKIIGDDGMEVPTGDTGQIAVRGPQMFQGYVVPEMNEGAFDVDGYLLTGDLGSMDADGFVRIVGRIKDVIIRKGENISAKEIEDLLFTHPDVREVAVIGLADKAVGERCCAVVVPAVVGQRIDSALLAQFLRAQGLMTQKIPEQWETVSDLPRNAAGKVVKATLRDQFRS